MSNGARHGLGVVIGLVVTPVIAVCLMYGTSKLRLVMTLSFGRFQDYHGRNLWIGAVLFAVAAVLLGLVAGSRLSPLASLIPGVVYAALGVVWFASPRWAVTHPARDTFPRDLELGYVTLGSTAVLFLLGVMLVVASLAPSRWKARAAAGAAPRFAAPPPAPMGPPPMHGAQAPMGAPQQPAQSPPWQGAPQYGAPPAQPASSNPPPLPPASPMPAPAAEKKPEPSIDSDDDEPGEWTRMYGGGPK